jgi:hypothetical protein
MHLSTAASELVLMLGFDFPPMAELTDRFELHKLRNRYGLMRSLIVGNPNTQYVLIDHPKHLEKTYRDLANLTCDNLGNVLKLLAQ